MNLVIYQVSYANGEKTVITDLQDAVLFVKDTYLSAEVFCWFNGNCVARMEINSTSKPKGE